MINERQKYPADKKRFDTNFEHWQKKCKSKKVKTRLPVRRLCRTCDLLGKPCKGAGHKVKGDAFWCDDYTPKGKKR